MLALTRRVGEEVVIGDPQDPMGLIRVVEVQGDKVRLAFDFPRDIAINRRELADAKAKGLPPKPKTTATPPRDGQPATPGTDTPG